MVSVEHDEAWYRAVQRRLRRCALRNVDYRRLPATPDAFAGVAQDMENESLDFALVDGASHTRAACALAVVSKIKYGGLLIVDDANWFLPSGSRAPNSIPPAGMPPGPEWQAFARAVAHWRVTWTSNGIKDTAIWVRPFE